MDCWIFTAKGPKVRGLLRLPRGERHLFFQALVLLRIVAAALWLLGLSRVQRVLIALTGRPRRLDSSGHEAVQSRARAVAAAARHGFPRANCLQQSLLLWWLLRRLGIAAGIHIGVRRHDSLLQAHAWVEIDGLVLIDTVDVRERFTPFERPIAPALADRR